MARQNLSSSVQISSRARRFLAWGAPGGPLSQFRTAAANREVQAANAATDLSRSTFQSRLSGRPLAPPRTGRPTTLGSFASDLLWEPDHRNNSIVFDSQRIRARAPYYLIQEIGTGQVARVLNPPGTLTIPSQRGRLIKNGLLQWASGPGAAASPPGRGGGLEQLYLVTDLNNATHRTRRMRIRREIRGKHYLRDGGIEGFRVLSEGLKADAQRIFQ
jgi:hypothetical protein